MNLDEPFDPDTAPPLLLMKEDAAALELKGPEGVIGNAVGDGVLSFPNRFVSHRHVHWQRIEAEAVLIRDLGSKNGTWVGDERLGSEPRRLALGGFLNMAQEGDWVLQSTWPRTQTLRKLPGTPNLRFHEYTNREVKASVFVRDHEVLALRGNRAKLLYLLAEKAQIDDGKDLARGSVGWFRRDRLFGEMWAAQEYDYRLLGRVLNETKNRLTEEGLEDIIEARDARSGRRASSQIDRIGELRLRRDGAWKVERVRAD